MEDSVAKKLPARPNLDHLRRQAKVLLAQLNDGEPPAVQAFVDHLPEARRMTAAAARAAGFRLADAQWWSRVEPALRAGRRCRVTCRSCAASKASGVSPACKWTARPCPARCCRIPGCSSTAIGFAPSLRRRTTKACSRSTSKPLRAQIDIEFVEGPEAGNTCYGIYELNGDRMTLCLGLAGASRPAGFVTTRGSGHALETLRRASAERPANVTGGTPPPAPSGPPATREDPSAFDVPMTPLLRRMEGEWIPVLLVRDGKAMPAQWLSFGSRTTVGNEIKVVFGGQVMVHAKVRVDEAASPIAIDYLNLDGKQAGTVSRGIMEWVGEEVRILMPASGQPRPADFSVELAAGTLSQWRRRKP